MNSHLTYIITGDEQEFNSRFDKFLASVFTDLSRTQVKNLMESGALKVNGISCSNTKMPYNIGDQIDIVIPEPKPSTLKPFEMDLDVVYEDEFLAIINKPAGITVHPGNGTKDDTLVHALIHRFGSELSSGSDSCRPGIVHRLDRDTTGLMIVAKTDKAHRKLSEMIERKEVARSYKALCYGTIASPIGTIETYYGRSRRDHKIYTVKREPGKIATTNYKVLEVFGDNALTLMELSLETGRTHQIRVHMDFMKCPIVGDQTYGLGKNFPLRGIEKDYILKLKSFPRQALHAYKIEFEHPITHEHIMHELDLPQDIKELIDMISSPETL